MRRRCVALFGAAVLAGCGATDATARECPAGQRVGDVVVERLVAEGPSCRTAARVARRLAAAVGSYRARYTVAGYRCAAGAGQLERWTCRRGRLVVRVRFN